MATYAIGDIHGCLDELKDLLSLINFDESNDKLWFVGDIVNRGPFSLETLRFVKKLEQDKRAIVVLGNHDVFLLSLDDNKTHIEENNHTKKIIEVLKADDRDELLYWLRQQKFLHFDYKTEYALCHAGIYPKLDLLQAKIYSTEAENMLRLDDYKDFFRRTYGNKIGFLKENNNRYDRIKFIINFFTRMRFCTPNCKLNLTYKLGLEDRPQNCIPWFKIRYRPTANIKIIYGHWKFLMGNNMGEKNIFPIDTGCVYGGELTAIRLEDQKLFKVKARDVYAT